MAKVKVIEEITDNDAKYDSGKKSKNKNKKMVVKKNNRKKNKNNNKNSKKRNKISKLSKKLKPMKIAALIMSAIQELGEAKGSTPSKITGFISYASNFPESRVKRQVNTALKRGVEYGILRRYRGHYFLPTGDELDRANRVAVRFARIPTPAPSMLKSNHSDGSKRPKELVENNRSRPRKTPHSSSSKQRRWKSLPASPVSTPSEISWDRDDLVMA